jgi:hypothetical protein
MDKFRICPHAVVIGRLSAPDAALVLGAPVATDVGSLHTERDNLRSRLDALGTMFGAVEIDAGQLKKGSAEIKQRLDTVEKKLAAARNASAVANVVLAGDDLAATWASCGAEVRGKVISALMTVTVLPAAWS